MNLQKFHFERGIVFLYSEISFGEVDFLPPIILPIDELSAVTIHAAPTFEKLVGVVRMAQSFPPAKE